MDKILLQNMMFYGFHGVHEYEREQGQRFYIDVEIALDLNIAGKTDDLTKTVDYTAVYRQIKSVVENTKFNLLEALAEHIIETIFKNELVAEVTVRIRKPAVPIAGQLDFVQIELTRGRKN